MRMQAGMALPVADTLDRTGFKVIDAAASSFMEVLVKYCREDPWEGLDLLRAAIHRTPMRGGMRGNACISFGVSPDALMDLWMRRLCEHGVRSFWIYDVLYGVDNFARLARGEGVRRGGRRHRLRCRPSTPTITWRETAEIAAVPEIDGVLFYDTAGVLDVSRLGELVPKIVAAAPKPVEIREQPDGHVGADLRRGRQARHPGAPHRHALDGERASTPSTESVVRNLELMDCTHSIDTSLLPPVEEHFRRVGRAAGYLVDAVSEYDLFNVTHQVPGGMVGTLKAQLEQHGMAHRIDEVLAETGEVRRELGWPVMATPEPARRHPGGAERRDGRALPARPRRGGGHAAGHYGDRPPRSSRTCSTGSCTPSRPIAWWRARPSSRRSTSCAERHGTAPDEDDLLILKALIPESDIAAMQAAGPVRRDYPLSRPSSRSSKP